VHGVGALVPGLEAELEGKAAGDKVEVRIAPEDGYGTRHEGMVQRVSRALLPDEVEPRVGMQLQTQNEQGPLVLTVVDVQDEEITVDGNHPLAGVTLHFEVDVKSVRAATAEEIEHGHVHEAGGHGAH
jgi:FKBP-type peptidyl-prolyl cis-trans isomerase SlyD